MTHRIDSRRINHFRTKVAKLHSFYITQLVYGISSADDTRVGGHKAVHIRPYLQTGGIQRCGNDGSRIIRTATSQVCHFSAVLVGRYKTGHQCYLRNFIKCFFHQRSCQFRIQNMFGMFFLGLDEVARIIPHRSLYQRCRNNRRQTFTVAHDSCRSFGRQILNQINTLKDIFQLTQQFIDLIQQYGASFARRNNGIHHFDVTVYYLTILFFILCIAVGCHL